jgi:hypothetical protein
MNREEITAALIAFEREAPRPIAPWHDIDFWPLIRTWLGMHLNATAPFAGWINPSPSDPRQALAIAASLPAVVSRYPTWLRELDRRRGSALLLSHANRRRTLDGAPFHRLATPLREQLRAHRLDLEVWDFEPDPVRACDTFPAQVLLSLRWRFSPDRRSREEPPDMFYRLAEWLGGKPVSAPPALAAWPFWQQQFSQLLFRSHHYERWLARLRPPLIFLDCWYAASVLPAILAARRLGIPTIDLQHGIQGASHFAYAAWPDGVGLSLFPDTFWVWGERDRAVIRGKDNALSRHSRCLVGGSLELNYLRESRSDASRPAATSHNLTVLVTEQKGIDVGPMLAPIIARTAGDIRWLIRPHPSEPEGLLRTALAADLPAVEFISPGGEPVFDSLARADLHLTGFSSVAIEALAMHRPTLLVHPAGNEIYREFIDRGLMRFVAEVPALLEALTHPDFPPSEAFAAAVESSFASPEVTRRALATLLEQAHQKTDLIR